MDLKEKKVAIVGGGGGIGREIALQLARSGAHIFVGDINQATAYEVAAEVKAIGRRFGAQRCDIRDDNSVSEWAEQAVAVLGGVDILINHAGVAVVGQLECMSSEDWNYVLNANVTGIGRSLRAFLPKMTGGWIVNTSSGLGLFHDLPIGAPYIASKAAIIGLSRALAVYLQNRNIGVSVFCPDLTNTGFGGAARIVGLPPEVVSASLPVARIQSAEFAANVLVEGLRREEFLISAVPDTTAKLLSMAAQNLRPGSDVPAEDRAPLIQIASFKVDPSKAVAVVSVLEDYLAKFRQQKGCRVYELRSDPTELGSFSFFEAWDSQADLDAHIIAPESLRAFGELTKLGMSDFKVRLY
jgi:NAD(P)-dependent dehydrogenase (short-subunit alcohol dehydrogenase family)/quinol monooxygenase YgiN